jgi:cation:H+ antiporter
VQWPAPVAGLALGSLLSAKLNQWTLLVGTIPGVFALWSGTLAHPLPMDGFQMHDILLTATQSLLGIVLPAGLRLSIGGGLLPAGLFFGQFLLPLVVQAAPGAVLGLKADQIHPVFSFLYLAAAAALFLPRPARVVALVRRPKAVSPPTCQPVEAENDFHSAHRRTCKYRALATQDLRETVNSRN